MSIVVKNKPAATPSWLQSATKSKEGLKQAVYASQQAAEASNLMRRFNLAVNEESEITFLDGTLDDDGALNFLSFHDHTIEIAPKKWDNFVCVAATEICPICSSGDKPSFVGVFTVIDHKPYTVKNGPNAGKVIVNQRKLYVAKQQTLQRLQHLSAKRGGMAGWKVEVSRLTDKEARVGSTFQFMNHSSSDELIAKYGEDAVPADYANEIKFMTAAEMITAGIGVAPKGPGYEKQSKISDDVANSM